MEKCSYKKASDVARTVTLRDKDVWNGCDTEPLRGWFVVVLEIDFPSSTGTNAIFYPRTKQQVRQAADPARSYADS